jgi:hypothetical protein
VAGVFQQILKAFLVLNIGERYHQNLLGLNNIGNLEWHYNNTLNKLIKADKTNATEYYIYDYQGNRVRSVVEFNNQVQNIISFFVGIAIAFLLDFGFVLAGNESSATIRVVMFITDNLGFVVEF